MENHIHYRMYVCMYIVTHTHLYTWKDKLSIKFSSKIILTDLLWQFKWARNGLKQIILLNCFAVPIYLANRKKIPTESRFSVSWWMVASGIFPIITVSQLNVMTQHHSCPLNLWACSTISRVRDLLCVPHKEILKILFFSAS